MIHLRWAILRILVQFHKNPYFSPFYIGWYDNGNQGIYGTESYNKLLECTLDANRDLVTMNAYLDDKKIVDVLIDNIDLLQLSFIFKYITYNKYNDYEI